MGQTELFRVSLLFFEDVASDGKDPLHGTMQHKITACFVTQFYIYINTYTFLKGRLCSIGTTVSVFLLLRQQECTKNECNSVDAHIKHPYPRTKGAWAMLNTWLSTENHFQGLFLQNIMVACGSDSARC